MFTSISQNNRIIALILRKSNKKKEANPNWGWLLLELVT